jgi:GT2 family glycosyltransferase
VKRAFVCTNYNNVAYTREAVISLNKNSEPWTIVVVDNNSNRENVSALEQLASEFSNVELVLSRENVGYFKGLNLGLRYLRSKCPDIALVVVGNNDLVFPGDFVESLHSVQELLERYPILAPNIVTLDGVHQNPHVVHAISPFREFVYDFYYANYYLALLIRKIARLTKSFSDRPDELHHETAQEIYQGYGACYVLGPMFFRHFEELWAPTFMMHEEYFLSKQLSNKGFRIYYEPSIKVLHHVHGAMGLIAGRKAWEAARDAHKVYRQHVKVFG